MWVVKLGGSLCEQAPETSPLRDWLDLLVREGAGRVVIVPGGGRFADAVRGAQAQWRFDDLTAHNMALLAMSQTAHLLRSLNPALRLCDREAALHQALRQGAVAVWSPLELQRDRAVTERQQPYRLRSAAACHSGPGAVLRRPCRPRCGSDGHCMMSESGL